MATANWHTSFPDWMKDLDDTTKVSVLVYAQNGAINQELTVWTVSPRVFKRVCYGVTWSNWVEYATTDYVSANYAPAASGGTPSVSINTAPTGWTATLNAGSKDLGGSFYVSNIDGDPRAWVDVVLAFEDERPNIISASINPGDSFAAGGDIIITDIDSHSITFRVPCDFDKGEKATFYYAVILNR